MAERKIAREIVTWIATVLLVLMFLNAGLRKFFEHGGWTVFFRRVGYPVWFRYLIGVLETGAALLLLVPRTAAYGAMVAIVVMIGAVGTVAMNGMPSRGLVPGTVSLLVATFIAIMRWRERAAIRPARPLVPQQ